MFYNSSDSHRPSGEPTLNVNDFKNLSVNFNMVTKLFSREVNIFYMSHVQLMIRKSSNFTCDVCTVCIYFEPTYGMPGLLNMIKMSLILPGPYVCLKGLESVQIN